MRKINEIILHCADTKITQNFSVEDVRGWHMNERGWSDCGYHYYIRLNGNIEIGRPIERSGAHAKGKNAYSIGICFEGGKLSNGDNWNTPMLPQIVAFKQLRKSLFSVFGELKIAGHYEYSSKTCPNFSVDIL